MGNSQKSLTPEEERVNEKIVAIQNHEKVQRMKKQLYDKFVHDYSKFISNEIHENQAVVQSTLLKNWEYNTK
jgi:hypothetical protein